MDWERQRSLWLHKGRYLERLVIQHQDQPAFYLVHRYAGVIVHIQQLWRAYHELVVPTVGGLGQHLRIPPDWTLFPLSEEATELRLRRVALTLADFEGTEESSAIVLSRSCVFQQLLQEVDEVLRKYAGAE